VRELICDDGDAMAALLEAARKPCRKYLGAADRR
jgi:hypothetical protein